MRMYTEIMFSSLILNTIPFLQNIAITLGIKDILDILIVAFLIYISILIVKRTHSTFIFFGVAILGSIYLAARVFNLSLTIVIFQTIFPFLVFVLVVIFQREIRYFFEWMATWPLLSFLKPKSTATEATLNDIVAAVIRLAETKTGALIVLTGRQSIDRFLSGGFPLQGKISVPLLLSIFDESSPGHDGAVIVDNNRIEKFGARLPLAEKFEYENLGTRHCAALGLSERSDALVIAVSEERGTISYAFGGTLTTVKEPIELKEALQDFLKDKMPEQQKSPLHTLITSNVPEKIAALAVAVAAWLLYNSI